MQILFTIRQLWRAGILVLTGLVLGACTPVGLAVGTVTTAGTLAVQERSAEKALMDKKIALGINESLFQYDIETFRKVSVISYEGRVLLTGLVKTEDSRARAVQLGWQTPGVREVINELEVSTSGDLLDSARDVWISTRLRSRLLLDGQVSSVNYLVTTSNARVYLLGIGQDQTELDRVIAHARNVPYVRRVVNYAILKDDPSRQP